MERYLSAIGLSALGRGNLDAYRATNCNNTDTEKIPNQKKVKKLWYIEKVPDVKFEPPAGQHHLVPASCIVYGKFKLPGESRTQTGPLGLVQAFSLERINGAAYLTVSLVNPGSALTRQLQLHSATFNSEANAEAGVTILASLTAVQSQGTQAIQRCNDAVRVFISNTGLPQPVLPGLPGAENRSSNTVLATSPYYNYLI